MVPAVNPIRRDFFSEGMTPAVCCGAASGRRVAHRRFLPPPLADLHAGVDRSVIRHCFCFNRTERSGTNGRARAAAAPRPAWDGGGSAAGGWRRLCRRGKAAAPPARDGGGSAAGKTGWHRRPSERQPEPVTDVMATADTATDAAALREAIVRKLTYDLGKSRSGARDRDWFMATALAVRDRVVDRWLETTRAAYAQRPQAGLLPLARIPDRPAAAGCVTNLGLTEPIARGARAARRRFRRDPRGRAGCGAGQRRPRPARRLLHGEHGERRHPRLSATASATTTGCSGRSSRRLAARIPEDWLTFGNPWEFERPEIAHEIGFGGAVEAAPIRRRHVRHVWHPAETVRRGGLRHADGRLARPACEHAAAVVGARARPAVAGAFNRGDHVGALADRVRLEAISQCSIRATKRRRARNCGCARSTSSPRPRCRTSCAGICAQLCDLHIAAGPGGDPAQRHPSGDRRRRADAAAASTCTASPWDEAWAITRGTISYTNHTLLPEALETWPVPLMERLLPRHMQIIYLINAQHLDEVRAAHAGDGRLLSSRVADRRERRPARAHGAPGLPRLAQGQRRLGAAHRADAARPCSATCTRSTPDRIVNKTNGITFRRWLQQANPGADRPAGARRSGRRVLDDADGAGAAGAAGRRRGASATRSPRCGARNKEALAALIADRSSTSGSTRTRMFDVHIKRIHEYKRQLLNILETVALYDAIRAQPDARLGAAREDLRRQGGGELPPRQADHQADPRRGARGEQRSRRCATC